MGLRPSQPTPEGLTALSAPKRGICGRFSSLLPAADRSGVGNSSVTRLAAGKVQASAKFLFPLVPPDVLTEDTGKRGARV